MVLTERQRKEFEQLSEPLIKWINDNIDPHATIIIDCETAEIKEGLYGFHTHKFIKD